MKITVKKWFADKTVCIKDGITLVWKKGKVFTGDENHNREDIEYFLNDDNWEEVNHIYGNVVRETEKAVMIEADYWDFRYCRYVNDAQVKHGWKVWIPKSVILNLDEVLEPVEG